MQELWPVLRMRHPGSEGRRVLLRSRVHVRTRLRLPALVRLRQREEAVALVLSSPELRQSAAPEILASLLARRAELLAFARARLRSEADAEDVLQQALVKAATHLDAIRDAERGTAWFYRILRNTLADFRAAAARQSNGLERFAREAIDAAPAESASCACSLGVLEGLRPEHARVLRRVDLDEAPLAEVAAELRITENATKVRLHRARKAMRAALLALCGSNSLRACLACPCD